MNSESSAQLPLALGKSPRKIPLDQLLFDPENPRLLSEANESPAFKIGDQDAILNKVAREFHLDELFDSIIGSGGYWEHEPLIAVSESDGSYKVLEGNRRLAAIKLLVDPALAARIKYTGAPKISEELRAGLMSLPVLIEEDYSKVWPLLGFKHVNGAKQWQSLAKARYIERVHERNGIPLEQIAQTIGDRNSTVQRLYHGLKVYNQAVTSGAFDPADRYHQRRGLPFTHLWTGLGYRNTREYLGVTDDSRLTIQPVPKERLDKLAYYCRYLYGSQRDRYEPRVISQNPDLGNVDKALGSEAGAAALERGDSLATAVRAATGDERLLLESLLLAETTLKEASAVFATGYAESSDKLKMAKQIKTVFILARSLFGSVKNDLDELGF